MEDVWNFPPEFVEDAKVRPSARVCVRACARRSNHRGAQALKLSVVRPDTMASVNQSLFRGFSFTLGEAQGESLAQEALAQEAQAREELARSNAAWRASLTAGETAL